MDIAKGREIDPCVCLHAFWSDDTRVLQQQQQQHPRPLSCCSYYIRQNYLYGAAFSPSLAKLLLASVCQLGTLVLFVTTSSSSSEWIFFFFIYFYINTHTHTLTNDNQRRRIATTAGGGSGACGNKDKISLIMIKGQALRQRAVGGVMKDDGSKDVNNKLDTI